MEQFLDNEISRLIRMGSKIKIDFLKQIKKKLLYFKNKDYHPSEAIELVIDDLIKASIAFLYEDKVITGLSTSIYLPSNQDYKINIMGGKVNQTLNINNETMFDLASITKFFTGLLTIKLEELGYLDFNCSVSSLHPDFKYLDNYTIKDIIEMNFVIETDERVDEAKSEEEAYQRLKTVKLKKQNEKHKYTDIGLIVLSYVIERVVNQKLKVNMTYDEIMKQYVLDPLELKDSTYKPNRLVAGNGNNGVFPYDPKCQKLNHPVGSAGLFSTTKDLENLAKELYKFKYISKEKLLRFGTIIDKDENKGNFGAYIRHPLGIQKTFSPNEYAHHSFAFQGSTGSVIVFDPHNKIHNSVLVNSLFDECSKRTPSYMDAYDTYHQQLINTSLELLLIKKYYENYVRDKEKVYQKVII
ncbi:MAG: serine hydrolase [Bacilli bacterium]|nr:serine hydrolase [Bacilli bacterium]MDD4808829.1 serine hydrolase [Bacilli bacterium]